MAKFTEEEIEILKSFVSDPTDNVFAVFPKAMPGMIGAAYARYSRAPGGFRETLLREFIKAGQHRHGPIGYTAHGTGRER